MKAQTSRILLGLTTSVLLLYTALFVYGLTLVGFWLMVPWAPLEFGLISLTLALQSLNANAKCQAIAATLAHPA